ncbi:MAG: hypothetical protein HS107_07505 [Thermoflexaceae bacterium]|nr:hypothetical protein [Thermoflexaceae bacterium]
MSTSGPERERVRRVRAALAAVLAGIVIGLAASACGVNDSPENPPPTATHTPPASPTPGSTLLAEPAETPTQLKVAFINLLSPLSLDANNPVAADTFAHRLDIIIEELRAFNPDIVGFNEASWTRATGSAAEKLAKALKLEFQYARANPWFPGQTQEQSDETVKLIGFEEGELILSRYPILRYERKALNPRTSETGEGRAALHAVVRVPGLPQELDVYITHLTGADEKVRAAQGADFTTFISATRGIGPLLVMGDLSEIPGGSVAKALVATGLEDVAAAFPGTVPVVTCCRAGIIGEQPALTTRTDYIFASGLPIESVGMFGLTPRKRADNTLVYASDHNGIAAVLRLPAPSR